LTGWPFEPFVRDIVALLVRGDYAALEDLSGGERLTAEELAQAVRDYPARLILPPTGKELPLDVVAVKDSRPRRWSVDVPLWSQEEGLSDLTLQLSITERPGSQHTVEIDDLHVL
jgi:hypothetical protein